MAGPNYTIDKGFTVVTTAVGQFIAVKQVAAQPEQVTVVTGAGDLAIGVIQQAVATADLGKQAADVRILGITKAVAGGTVANGDKVKVNASGQLITTTTALDKVVGICLTGGVVNDWIDVLLTPGATI
jgi:hypothetical protein